MANRNPLLIDALRETADRLEGGARYEWGHMGRCNCGHLVQTVTRLTDREIVAAAEGQMDEWTEHARAYCPNTGQSMEDLFRALSEIGFEPSDVAHLEYLSDPAVLRRMAPLRDPVERNRPAHVSAYLRAMAGMLEERRTAR